MIDKERMTRQLKTYRWPIFLLACICYTLTPFQRMAPNIMGPELIKDLSLSAVDFGFLGLAFFWTFGLMQAPVGTLMDKWGPRRGLTLLLAMTATGCFLFGYAPTFPLVVVGRVIIAISIAGFLTAGAKITSEWFTAKEYPQMWGIFMAFGYIGGIAATTPLQTLIGQFGWRGSYFILAGACAIICLIVYLVVRDRPADKGWASPDELYGDGVAKAQKPKVNWLADWKELVTQRKFVAQVLFFVGIAASAQIMVALWGGVYLADVYKFPKPLIAELFRYWAITMVVGSLISGTMIRLLRTAGVLTLASSVFLCLWLYITVHIKTMSIMEFKVVFSLLGIVHTLSITSAFAYIREWVEPARLGTAMGLVNGVQWLLGAGTFQQLWGFIIKHVSGGARPYSAEAFQTGMWLNVVLLVISVLCALYLLKTYKPANSAASAKKAV